ncbi:unnamed protein product [Caenorhabditis bovis]|uniref:Uncharacterized protein n=1 Tax=Caenorhabditis bovis TaxID=2654633 RepID=A0A8S1ELW9_9PELO|nr:unnamed protein product [Caenorhabditis bovis]
MKRNEKFDEYWALCELIVLIHDHVNHFSMFVCKEFSDLMLQLKYHGLKDHNISHLSIFHCPKKIAYDVLKIPRLTYFGPSDDKNRVHDVVWMVHV